MIWSIYKENRCRTINLACQDGFRLGNFFLEKLQLFVSNRKIITYPTINKTGLYFVETCFVCKVKSNNFVTSKYDKNIFYYVNKSIKRWKRTGNRIIFTHFSYYNLNASQLRGYFGLPVSLQNIIIQILIQNILCDTKLSSFLRSRYSFLRYGLHNYQSKIRYSHQKFSCMYRDYHLGRKYLTLSHQFE